MILVLKVTWARAVQEALQVKRVPKVLVENGEWEDQLDCQVFQLINFYYVYCQKKIYCFWKRQWRRFQSTTNLNYHSVWQKKEIREKEVQTDCLAYLEMRARSDQKVIQENQVWSIVFCFDFFQRISCLYTSHILNTNICMFCS